MFIKDGINCTEEVYNLLCMLELNEKVNNAIVNKSDPRIGIAFDRSNDNRGIPTLWICTSILIDSSGTAVNNRWGQRIHLNSDGIWVKTWSLSIANFNDITYRDYKVANNYKEIVKVMKEMQDPKQNQIKELETKLAAEKNRHCEELTKIQEQIAALKK